MSERCFVSPEFVDSHILKYLYFFTQV